ncbi:MAG: amino acid racemase [Bdellovibrionota bacterium]
MSHPKHIGIASVTAEGGAIAYLEIVHASEKMLGENQHPEISLHSHSFSKFVDSDYQQAGAWDLLMIESSQKLKLAGAEFFICPANTNHVVFERVQDRIYLPWLHIAEVVAERARDLGCGRALLLGTKTLMRSDVYRPFLDAQGVELVLPEAEEQDELNRIIYDELVRGMVVPSSKAFVERTIERSTREQGSDSVILGCTELPMLDVRLNPDVQILDSTRLLARGAVALSVGMTRRECEALVEAARGKTG